MQQINKTSFMVSIFLVMAILSCIFTESMAGKGKGGSDIILYNGNIVVRGGGKGKGKGGGSIIVANSRHGKHHEEMMPHWGGHWGGFRRRR